MIHDFAGHPGQIQLSRELARRGHVVEHHYCQSVATGQGATRRRHNDPPTFSIVGISLKSEFARYSPIRRIFQEFKYAWLSIRKIFRAQPDVVIFANVPVVPLLLLIGALCLRRPAVPYISWWQDVYSEAVGTAARNKLGAAGEVVAWIAERIEVSIAKRAAAIVPIADAFVDRLNAWDIGVDKVRVIPNWGALEEVPSRPRMNAWSEARGLSDYIVLMYAGTLGLKHDPSLIAELVRVAPDNCRVVVVSQGKGREWLEEKCGDYTKLILLDYQPYEDLPNMLGSADLLLAILEPDASQYSVPSKILNYLCAGRPVLALLPAENAAAQTVEQASAGVVARPGDKQAASEAFLRLVSDSELRLKLGSNGRRYAERVFDIQTIGDSFEEIIRYAVDKQAVAVWTSKRDGDTEQRQQSTQKG